MKLVTCDIESFYSQTYSLTKLNTEAYIRSPEFELIGVSIAVDDAPPQWYPQPEVKTALAAIDRSDAMLLCMNTAFDAAILAWHYGVQPKVLCDIMGMSCALFPHEKSHSLASQAKRAELGAKGDEVIHALGKRFEDFDAQALARYGQYCCNDVVLTRALFKRYIAMGFPVQELRLIDLTLQMFVQPVLRLDADLLTTHLAEVRERKEALLSKVTGTDSSKDIKSVLLSNEQFSELLRSFGVDPPRKISLTTGKETYALAKTDEEFIALQNHEDARIQALVAARLGVKSTLEETRTERFIEMCGRGAFPVSLKYYGAHTGRWAGNENINIQNLPSRGDRANKLKSSILPPEGYVIINSDSAQIEVRVLAWLAGQDDLVESFRKKEDVYRQMAATLYSKSEADVSKSERFIGKTVVLGCGYGTSSKKLQSYLKSGGNVVIDDNEAKRIVDTYRRVNHKIVSLWKSSDAALRHLFAKMPYAVDPNGRIAVVPNKGLTLPNGLHIQYPGLREEASENGKMKWVYDSKGVATYIFGAKVVENFTQSFARCIIAEQMLRIARRYKVVMTVHDSVVCVAPKDEAVTARAYVEECMRWVPSWATGLPLECESGVGESYGAC